MNNLKKLILTSMIATTGIMGTSIIANATVSHPSGGTWNYGLVNHNPYYMAYSYYYHPTRWHTSTAQLGGREHRVKSGRTRYGKTSIANTPTLYKTTNAYYWYDSDA